MRPAQIVIAVAFSLTAVLTITWLRYSPSSQTSSLPSASSNPGVRRFLPIQASFSLFPPSALISLTHNNKTSFLAKPAAFGPLLLPKGLSGQVWLGGGFDDIVSGSQLGCSDVEGWSVNSESTNYNSSNWKISSDSNSKSISKAKPLRSNFPEDKPLEIFTAKSKPWTGLLMRTNSATDDLVDEYAHNSLAGAKLFKLDQRNHTEASKHHADVQSMQEGAEIAGKVVLLSRGGCGFLDKVKWAQRRGAVAVIVGGNTKGGPLIQMYATGDTSSITIPSVFTSYTTANLLYTLATKNSEVGEIGGDVSLDSKKKSDSISLIKKSSLELKPTSNNSKKSDNSNVFKGERDISRSDSAPFAIATKKSRWLSSIFASSNDVSSKLEQSRPPSSGQLEWVLVDDRMPEKEVESEVDVAKKAKHLDSIKLAKLETSNMMTKHTQGDTPYDDFVSNAQDWHGPDLVEKFKSKRSELTLKTSSSSLNALEVKSKKYNSELSSTHKHSFGALAATPENPSSLKGRSITPSSGEYTFERREKDWKGDRKTGIISTVKDYSENQDVRFQKVHEQHEGLWVTLSPSSGSNPFMDTLLVLVVSPLITLTMVYAMLLLRSKYREQKWRAPKSVVERLPVRTYQTMDSTGANSPRLPNLPTLSVTTPLLQSITNPGSKPQTIGSISGSNGPFRNSIQNQNRISNHRNPSFEKNVSRSGPCKNPVERYTECVVCLEEYVNGVSRIMGLPCGHEFHVECITPWLTTRRRTCPICKGDVVRSLARASRYESLKDDDSSDEENDHGHIDQRMTHSSSSEILVNFEYRNDLELGRPLEIDHQPEADRTNGWGGLLMNKVTSILRSMRSTREDRDR